MNDHTDRTHSARIRENLRQVAEEAYAAYSYSLAIEHYNNLLNLVVSDSEKTTVKIRLAYIQSLTGLWSDAQELIASCLNKEEQLSDAERARAYWILGDVMTFTDDPAKALNHLETGKILFEAQQDTIGLTDSYISIARIERQQGQLSDAQSTLQNALQIAQSSAYQAGIIRAINEIAAVHFMQADKDIAFAHYDRAREMATEADDKYNLLIINNDVAGIHFAMGEQTRALQYCRQAYELAQLIGHQWIRSVITFNVSEVYRINGNFEQASLCSRAALGDAITLDDTIGIIAAAGLIGDINNSSDNKTRATAFYKQMLRLAKEIGATHVPQFCHYFQAYANLLMDEEHYEEASSIAQLAKDIATEIEDEDNLFRANLILILLEFKTEQQTAVQTIERLKLLIGEDMPLEHEVMIQEKLCTLNPANTEAQKRTQELYRQLYEDYKAYDYKQKYEALSEDKLSPLPELPMMIDVIEGDILEHDILLQRLAKISYSQT